LYESYRQSLAEVKGLQTEVLPLLKSAMKSTSDAFAQGRYGYMELNAAQTELLDAQQSLIDAAVSCPSNPN
jgi:cobalt-zinc-cadmium efflux system outer membrane protein